MSEALFELRVLGQFGEGLRNRPGNQHRSVRDLTRNGEPVYAQK